MNQGRRVGGPEGDNPPLACVLETAPTNAQLDNLLLRVHEECYVDPMFREAVIADHPAPWSQLRAPPATAPRALQSCDQKKVQETPRKTPGCRPTLASAVKSCCVVFTTAGIVANRHRLLPGGASRRLQSRVPLTFVDEASRHSIPVGACSHQSPHH